MLLCHPIQDGQGAATSWGCLCVPGLLHPLGSWRVLLFQAGAWCSVTAQAGALAWKQVLQEPVHSPGVARVVAQAPSPDDGH